MKGKGQTTIVSAALYMLVTIAVIAIVLQIGLPYLTKVKEYGEIRKGETVVKALDEVISIVASEGEGSKRRIEINLSDPMDINGERDLITIHRALSSLFYSLLGFRPTYRLW